MGQRWPQPGEAAPIGVPIGPAQLNGQVYDIVVAPDRLLVGRQYSISFAEIRDVLVDDTSYTVRKTPKCPDRVGGSSSPSSSCSACCSCW